MNNAVAEKPVVVIPFSSIRKISSPEDDENDRVIYTGHLPILAVLKLPTHENVREYLLDAEGLQRRRPTQVHRAIRETLKERSEMFSVLNGGVVIVAEKSEIDEKGKKLKLTSPSIINGSQTQGVIRDFQKDYNELPDVHVKFELVITSDSNLVAEISISRNFQNDVEMISIMGRRGQLDQLEEAIKKVNPDYRLRKSETQRPSDENDILPTEKLVQVIAALIPSELWLTPGEPNKTYTYAMKTRCLKDFQEIYQRANDTSSENHERYKCLYQFYLDIADEAYVLYKKWKQHQGFSGTGLRAIQRDGAKIIDVPDGIVFPILASLSEFATQTDDGWTIQIPKQLRDEELINVAKSAYMEIAKSQPNVMGKTKACYTQIQQITSVYRRLTQL